MREHNKRPSYSRKFFKIKVGSFLITLINGVENARETEWAMQVKDEYSTWLNQPDFLTHFTTQVSIPLYSNRMIKINDNIILDTREMP
jgi:hypothetical protein